MQRESDSFSLGLQKLLECGFWYPGSTPQVARDGRCCTVVVMGLPRGLSRVSDPRLEAALKVAPVQHVATPSLVLLPRGVQAS